MDVLKPCQLFQNSLMSALLAGDFEGRMTVSQLLEKGDTGLGTFEGLDGEMVVLDGRAYKVTSDGKATKAPLEERSPFAALTFFSPSIFLEVKEGEDFEGEIRKRLPGPNYPCAVKASGEFKKVATRTVSKRGKKPWDSMKEAVDEQKVCEFEWVRGEAVGFWMPKSFEGLCVADFHLHFISQNRGFGGHILSLIPGRISVQIAFCPLIVFSLPQSPLFADSKLTFRDISSQIAYAEKTHE